MKDTFSYQYENFVNSETNREKLKELENKKTDLSLDNKKNKYITLYATHNGIAICHHENLEEATTTLNINKVYYRQLWTFNENKGAYNYAANYEKGKEIIL